MLFKIKDLKQFLSSVNKHRIEDIHIKSKNLRLTINAIKYNNRLTNSNQHYPATKNRNLIENKNTYSTKNEQNKKIKTSREQGTYFTIVSPMIGTFYRSPAPNEPPFVKVDESVTVNQTVCIIEAMKLMNEIESEVNGNIAEILVQDGDIVDCGQALIRVKQKI